MKSLHHYVRSVRRELVGRQRLGVALARDYLFTRITVAVLCHRGLLDQQAGESVESCRDALRNLLGSVPTYVSRAAALVPSSISMPSEMVRALMSDPINVGWSYQFWNEAERDESTFAISRQGEQDMSQHSLTAATQLFTEDYMSEVLVDRCLLSYAGRADRDVLDPACGTGHILVHAFRHILGMREGIDGEIVPLMGRIFGCDIDPDAVELCRMVLFLEATKSPIPKSDIIDLWQMLAKNIQVVSSDYGTLDRTTQCALLQRRYGCVLSNPPYIGRRKLTDAMRCFLDSEYPATSMDLCSAFMQRCTELLEPGGWLGLVTVDKWLRLKGYEVLRTGGPGFAGLYRMCMLDLVCELGQRAFSPWSSLHDGVGIALITAQYNEPPSDHSFRFLSCADVAHHSQKAAMIKVWRLTGEGSSDIPQREVMTRGKSVSFVINHGVPPCLISSRLQVEDVANVVVGLQTGDDRRFVKYVWSVPPDKDRWIVHSKGGGYERWFGLNRYLLDWREGRPVFEKTPKSGLSVERWFPTRGWTYTWFANGSLGLRMKDCGWSFGRAAASGFFCEDARLVGFLNSRVASLVARRKGGKAQLPEGTVRGLPIPHSLDGIDARLVDAAVGLKRALVERDLTDASFRPSPSFEPLVIWSVNALLLVVEGELERQVCELLQMDVRTRQSLDDVMGRPVGWSPFCGDLNDEVVWSLIPQQFQFIRSLLNYSPSASTTFDACTERVRAYFAKGAKTCLSGRPLPATSLLEQVCRGTSGHPFDVVRVLSTLHTSDSPVASAVIGPLLRSRIVEVVLSELGHQWWATTERYDSTLHSVRSTEEITEKVSRVLSGVPCEKILGETLEGWILGKMESWHNRLFLNEPLLVAKSTKAHRCVAFGHRWSGATPPSACDTREIRERCSL